MSSSNNPIVFCATCRGDARASSICSMCRGAQAHIESEWGTLVWLAPLDSCAFLERRIRQIVRGIFHAFIVAVICVCLLTFLLITIRSPYPVAWFSLGFWLNGSWQVSLFLLGLFLICFLIFRLAVYREKAQSLPFWGESRRKKSIQKKKSFVRDVSIYATPALWQIIYGAYTLASHIGLTEIEPVHIVAATLTSPVGGIFITRLGLDFDKIKDELAQLCREGQRGQPTLPSVKIKEVLLHAYEDAAISLRKHVGVVECFVQAFLADEALEKIFDRAGHTKVDVLHVAEWIRLQELMKEEYDRFGQLARFKPKTTMNRTMTARQTPLLDRFSEDLTLLARHGYLAPMIGRDKEMGVFLRAIESGRRALMVIGEAGVGKFAFLEALARRMVEEDVPAPLFDKRLVSVDLVQLVSSDGVDRLLNLLNEVQTSGNIVLVLRGMEALIDVSGGPMGLAEAFMSEWERGSLLVIGTTTPQIWRAHFERRSLVAQFARIDLPELSQDDAIRVLMARTGHIEYQNNVFFSYASLARAVFLAGKFIRDVCLPESALNIAKETAVFVKGARGEGVFVSADDVAHVIHEKTRIPVEAITQDEGKKLLAIEDTLHGRIIGQEEAVKAVAQAIRRARVEIREAKRPIANFLFLGPTGVGKTELAKALADAYFGSEQSMIRLDMSEYQDQFSVHKIIGAAGDDRGGLLTEAIRKNPFSLVLLDELEKAHPNVLTLFLQVMDDGRLTDGIGRTIDCTNIILIATSNAGTQYIQDQVRAQVDLVSIKTALMERELRGVFRPEFLNRFDGVIVFKPLSMDDVTQIAWLMLESIRKRLDAKGIVFRAEDVAVEELARAGFDPLFGARPLRRVIQEKVENMIANILLRQEVQRRDTIVFASGGTMRVEKEI